MNGRSQFLINSTIGLIEFPESNLINQSCGFESGNQRPNKCFGKLDQFLYEHG